MNGDLSPRQSEAPHRGLPRLIAWLQRHRLWALLGANVLLLGVLYLLLAMFLSSRSAEPTSYRYSISGSVTFAGVVHSISGEGACTAPNRKWERLTIGDQHFESISIDQRVYIKNPSGTWTISGRAPGSSTCLAAVAGSAEALRGYKSAYRDLVLVGGEVLDGERVDHYQGILAATIPGLKSSQGEFWVRQSDHVVVLTREEWVFEDRHSVEVIRYYAFGEPVTVEPPPGFRP